MSTQKALYLVEAKGALAVRERDIPTPGPGEILVEIHATALNPVDWKIQAFDFFIKEYPAILGTDAAGIVKAVGEGVTNLAVGDKVYVPSLPTSRAERLTRFQLSGCTRGTSTTGMPRSSSTRSCLLRLPPKYQIT